MSNELFLVVVIMDWYTSHGYFFLHLAGLGVGAWGMLLASVLVFSNFSHVFPHELILPLAIIHINWESVFFSPLNI